MGLLDIFGGGDGTSSTDALYAGLLTPEQIAAVKREQAQKGLLAMAAAFGQAGMPSRLPVPTGAVLGQVAGAMGQVDDTGAIAKFLTAQKLAAETQTLKAKQEWIKRANDPNDPLAKLIDRYYGGAGTSGGTVPPPAGTPVDADGKPLASIPSAARSSRGGIDPAAPFGTSARTSGSSVDPGDPSTWPVTTNIPPELAGDTLGGVPGLRDTLQSPLSPGGTLGARLVLPVSAAPPGQGAAAAPAVPFPTRVSGPAVPAPTWVGNPDSMISALAMNRTPPPGARIPPLPAGGVMPPPRAGSFTPPGDTDPYAPGVRMAGFATPQQFRQDVDVTDAGGGGTPDVVIPSSARPALPVIRTQAQLPPNLANPSPPGAPPATAGAPRAGGIPAVPATPGGAPQPPPPPPGDQAGMGAILRELARRNATAEMLGLGTPYSGLISILQNSPQAEALKEYQRRSIGLGFAGPEAAAQAGARFPFEMTAEQYKSSLRSYENQVKALGDATLEPAKIRVADGRGGFVELDGTKEQAARAANGFAVPELSIPGLDARRPPGAPGVPTYGTPAGTPIYGPTEQSMGAALGKEIPERRAKALDSQSAVEGMNQARSLLDAPGGIYSGTWGPTQLAIAKSLGTLGRNPAETIANTEAFLAQRARDVATEIKNFGAGTGLSDADRQYAAKIVGGDITLNEDSIRKIFDIGERHHRRLIDSFNKDASRINPALSPYPLTVDAPPLYEKPTPAGPAGPKLESRTLGGKTYYRYQNGWFDN